MTFWYVRVTDDLMAQIQAVLPDERGEDGTPWVHDFVRTDLVRAQDRHGPTGVADGRQA